MARGRKSGADAEATIGVVVNADAAATGASKAISVVKGMETEIDKSTASAGKKAGENLKRGLQGANQQLDQLGKKAQETGKKVEAALDSVAKHQIKRAADIELENKRKETVGERNRGTWTHGAQRIEQSRIVA